MLPERPKLTTLSDILYIITDLLVGGVPLHLRKLALQMRRRGYGVRVISLAPPGPVAEMLQEDGVPVDSCHGAGGWDFRVIGRLARLIRQYRPDLIHALLFHGNLASRWAARRAGFPAGRVICEIQTVELERRWHLLVDRFTHQGCRFTIGNSPSVIEHLATRARIPWEHLRLVRGGVNLERIDQAEPVSPTALGLQDTDRLVLWVGRLDPVKGLDILIDAFSAVPAYLNPHLLLAGAGLIRDRLERQIATLRLTDRVHLLGSRDDVPSLLKVANLFVFPSRTEGLPNALLEAMAAGRPIITTDVPGCRDLIRHEANGLLTPFGDTKALANAIARMLFDRDLAGRLGREARQTAQRDWPIEKTYDTYEACYQEALTDRM
jgi:glycosyltransferase involved in cell wall biosynthesis